MKRRGTMKDRCQDSGIPLKTACLDKCQRTRTRCDLRESKALFVCSCRLPSTWLNCIRHREMSCAPLIGIIASCLSCSWLSCIEFQFQCSASWSFSYFVTKFLNSDVFRFSLGFSTTLEQPNWFYYKFNFALILIETERDGKVLKTFRSAKEEIEIEEKS